MTELTLKIISDLAYNATKVEQWIANFTATVRLMCSVFSVCSSISLAEVVTFCTYMFAVTNGPNYRPTPQTQAIYVIHWVGGPYKEQLYPRS